MAETVWNGRKETLYNTPDISSYQPWRTLVWGKRTCTADMCIAQDIRVEEKSAPIDRKDIAQALHLRNLLRFTESIQISPNGRFCSVNFSTKQIMETFCTEGLVLSESIKIYFKPDFKTPPKRTYTFISFLNVPLETKEEDMTKFVRQFCTVHGVHYPTQKIDDIKYRTGTRVYRVSNIKEHIPRSVHIFGRWSKVIYDGQPSRQSRRK